MYIEGFGYMGKDRYRAPIQVMVMDQKFTIKLRHVFAVIFFTAMTFFYLGAAYNASLQTEELIRNRAWGQE